MKPLFVFFLCILFITVSCTKIVDPKVTSFQLVFTDYSTGDTLPNVPFWFRGTNSLTHNFDESTNQYGNFDTIIQHAENTDFYFNIPYGSTDFVPVESNNQIEGGTNTDMDISVIQPSELEFIFDCSGSGYIQNVYYYRLAAIPDTFPLANHQYAQSGYPTINCGYSSIQTIFPGDWVIRYQYHLTTSSPWNEILDTVSVLPDEVLEYTIIY